MRHYVGFWQIRSHMYTCARTNTHKHMYTCTNTHTHVRTHTHTYTHTHTHTHTRTHIHSTHTSTHVHTRTHNHSQYPQILMMSCQHQTLVTNLCTYIVVLIAITTIPTHSDSQQLSINTNLFQPTGVQRQMRKRANLCCLQYKTSINNHPHVSTTQWIVTQENINHYKCYLNYEHKSC